MKSNVHAAAVVAALLDLIINMLKVVEDTYVDAAEIKGMPSETPSTCTCSIDDETIGLAKVTRNTE
jgi:hypothetical protein